MNSSEPDALDIRRQNRLLRKRRYRENLTDEARAQATLTDTSARQIARENLTDEARSQLMQTDTSARQIARENLTDEARLQATQTNTSARQIERNLKSTRFVEVLGQLPKEAVGDNSS
jgi:hypothetical protein